MGIFPYCNSPSTVENMNKLVLVLSTILLSTLCTAETTLEPGSTSAAPCWAEAFPTALPNITITGESRVENDLTCDVCNQIFQGLDDVLLENEEQIAHALENLCEGMPWLFEICWRVVESCMDELIELLIEYGLNPTDMCEALLLCP